MRRNIALRLQYDGTAYHGWQVQKTDVTVAETLERALTKVCGEPIKVVGCGRTDAGVHAKRYCANFRTDCKKNIALIAHDSKKHEMIDWCEANKEILKGHFLCGTGTTARMITEATGLPVKGYNSGPLGGDQQIGAKIVEGRIDFVVFFSDPLTAQPHDPDVKALLRIAQVYDIPIANNRATADFMITSPLMNEEYDHQIINFHQNIKERASKL